MDPRLRSLLEIINRRKIDFSTISVEELRQFEPLSTPATQVPGVRIEDCYLPRDEEKVPLRMYTPENPGNGLIIYFHGGGYVLGSIESGEDICRRMAGLTSNRVLSLGYRLAPEYKFPVPQEDAYSCYLYAVEHAAKLGIDNSRIALTGESSGGTLAISTCLMANDRHVPQPRFILSFYPAVSPDFSSESSRFYSKGYFLTKEAIEFFSKQVLRTKEDVFHPYFSPLLAENISGLPETMIVTAEFDPLRDGGEALVARLQEAGIRASGIRVQGMIHGFLGFRHFLPTAENIFQMACSLLRFKLETAEGLLGRPH